jgi:hypothetical protein
VLADQGALGQPVLRWHMLQHPGQKSRWKVKYNLRVHETVVKQCEL